MRLLIILLATTIHSADWQPLEVVATAYCPCKICCGSRAVGITADGTDTRVWPYGVAVEPKLIPYGSLITVPAGHGYLDHQQPDERVFYADDTGGTIRKRTKETGVPHIDLRFIRHSSAIKFGVRRITIYVWKD